MNLVIFYYWVEPVPVKKNLYVKRETGRKKRRKKYGMREEYEVKRRRMKKQEKPCVVMGGVAANWWWPSTGWAIWIRGVFSLNTSDWWHSYISYMWLSCFHWRNMLHNEIQDFFCWQFFQTWVCQRKGRLTQGGNCSSCTSSNRWGAEMIILGFFILYFCYMHVYTLHVCIDMTHSCSGEKYRTVHAGSRLARQVGQW